MVFVGIMSAIKDVRTPDKGSNWCETQSLSVRLTTVTSPPPVAWHLANYNGRQMPRFDTDRTVMFGGRRIGGGVFFIHWDRLIQYSRRFDVKYFASAIIDIITYRLPYFTEHDLRFDNQHIGNAKLRDHWIEPRFAR